MRFIIFTHLITIYIQPLENGLSLNSIGLYNEDVIIDDWRRGERERALYVSREIARSKLWTTRSFDLYYNLLCFNKPLIELIEFLIIKTSNVT